MKDSRLRSSGAACAALMLFGAAVAPIASAQLQSSDQQKCITGVNKAAARMAAAQNKSTLACVKNSAKGTETDATSCIGDDDGGKVADAEAKVGETFTKACSELPDFGPSGAGTVTAGVDLAASAHPIDLFGADVTGALQLSSSNADGAACQAAVTATSQKLFAQVQKDFNACKSAGLKSASIASASALASCFATVNADAKGKIAKASIKLREAVGKSCEGQDLSVLFPGTCSTFTRTTDCLLARTRCRACMAFAIADQLPNACDRFDDGLPGNNSCGDSEVTTEHVTFPNGVDPAESPGTAGVVVTNSKLLTQFPPSGPNMNQSDYVRWRYAGPETTPDAVLILVPGFGAGVNIFRVMAEDLIPKFFAETGQRLEIWGFSRRDDRLEDREGAILATANRDLPLALDWYYGAELGLPLSPELTRRAVFYNTSNDIPFLANYTPQVFSRDIDAVVEAAKAITPNVFLGGHSAGTGFTARYAATDFNFSGMGPAEPGFSKLKGLVLLEGGGGTTAASAPLSSDTLDRIIAKADGGLFGAVRDNAPRCVNGTTPCAIATEAADCIGQVPPKCTLPTTSYSALGGLKPELYAAGEIGGIQGIEDPETGQVIIQVDQGSPGNNAIAKVPGLSPLAPPLIPPSTVEGLFGIFLDDDGLGVLLSPALATSLGANGGANANGLRTWIDIDGDGQMPSSAVANNGPAPTTLPAGIWGLEVEVTRMDRHRMSFIQDGENSSDWYYAGSGLSTLGVTGVCSAGACTVGKSGSCATNSDCSQSISLDSSDLAVGRGRPDIANMTQAANIDIPVISFGGSNGLTPVGASFAGFAQSIGTCTAPSCDGTARVVSATLPNPAFPTYGSVAGGYEVYISEGYAHVDVVTAEDTDSNLIPERLIAFLTRNME